MSTPLTSICPFCSYEHQFASAVATKPAPLKEPMIQAGDATLCIRCGEISIMDRTGEMLRKPTATETQQLNQDPMIRLVQSAWRDTIGKGKRV